MLKRTGWTLMAILAAIIALYALAQTLAPGLRVPFVRDLFARTPLTVLAHMGAAGVALATGAFQVNTRLRNRYLSVHRWTGRVYIVAVLIGGASGFALALRSSGGLVAHVGFGLLAIGWLSSTAMAYRRILAGDIERHRRWMLRSYGFAFAAVTLRIYLPLSLAGGIAFDDAYPVIAWLAWVPNVLVVEWALLARRYDGIRATRDQVSA